MGWTADQGDAAENSQMTMVKGARPWSANMEGMNWRILIRDQRTGRQYYYSQFCFGGMLFGLFLFQFGNKDVTEIVSPLN